MFDGIIKQVYQEMGNNPPGLSENIYLEYKHYKPIPKTNASYRKDSGNNNTCTQNHLHVFAKPEGAGNQLYAVNQDGSGHDGSSGYLVPDVHAQYLRSIGYNIPSNNILEYAELNKTSCFEFIICKEITEQDYITESQKILLD